MSTGGVSMTVQLDGLTGRLVHGPSGASITTTPPRDNGGDGSAFSPTDLFAVSLGACALSTMALVAPKEGLTFPGGRVSVLKEMTGPPRRVGAVTLDFALPDTIPGAHRPRLEAIAHGCPVARSLAPDVEVRWTFSYAG